MAQSTTKSELLEKFNQLEGFTGKDFLSADDVKKALGLIESCELLIDRLEYMEIEKIKKAQSQLFASLKELEDKLKIEALLEILNILESNVKKIVKNVHNEKIKASSNGHKDLFARLFDGAEFNGRVITEVKKLKTDKIKFDEHEVCDSLKTIFFNVEFNFKQFYDLRSSLCSLAADIRNVISPDLQKEVIVEFKHLSIKVAGFEESLESEVTFVHKKFAHIIHLLTYSQRFELLKEKIDPILGKREVDLKAIVRKTLEMYSNHFIEAKSLNIDYENPEKTFVKESTHLLADQAFVARSSESQIKECIKVLTVLIKLIKREYFHRCDSPYHGIAHMSQVTITSLRIFINYQKHHNLGIIDFFNLIATTVLHDTGYFSEHFRHSCPGYLSSMSHVDHETKSSQYAEYYLNHFRKEIASLNLGIGFDEVVSYVQHIIDATMLFGFRFESYTEKYKELQMIIQCADLLELCTENYINILIPLYKENKIGNPKGPWPKDLHQLLSETPPFMTENDLINGRVNPMMKFLKDHPNYEFNRKATSDNLSKFFKILEKQEKTEEQAAAETERWAA